MSCQVHTTANAQLAKIRRLPAWYLKQAAEAMEQERLELGKRIKEARDKRGMKQKHLAAAVHVEPVTVSRWETGKHEPDFETLGLIAKALKQPVSYFVDEPEDLDRLSRIENELGQVRGEVAEIARLLTERLPRQDDEDEERRREAQ